jgi:hypothetical protein
MSVVRQLVTLILDNGRRISVQIGAVVLGIVLINAAEDQGVVLATEAGISSGVSAPYHHERATRGAVGVRRVDRLNLTLASVHSALRAANDHVAVLPGWDYFGRRYASGQYKRNGCNYQRFHVGALLRERIRALYLTARPLGSTPADRPLEVRDGV